MRALRFWHDDSIRWPRGLCWAAAFAISIGLWVLILRAVL